MTEESAADAIPPATEPHDRPYGIVFSASCARATSDELAEYLAFALTLCDEADAIALRHFRREMEIVTKPDRSFVTEADRSIERLVRERIHARWPNHGFVGEEYGEDAGASTTRWYIDPIDGTHNFIRGVPLFGTLLALEIDGELQVGVLSAPALRERWYASRGAGAWAVGAAGMEGPRPIRVSRVTGLADAQVLYGSGAEIETSGRAPGFRGLLGEVWRERGFGDFWGYALLAEGAAEAMVEIGVHTWDLAAPLVLIEEAGGRLTDLHGLRRIDGHEMVATNGLVHEAVLARLQQEG
ncbi:MAG TPA: inositol monophosphatase family protein [Candidatus Acidoferrum sp.]|jgi:histidinol-phosphatase|nr:inositol monophosphatase family protein [Candidatus Acidoferrum sp.]